jgi:FAD/FMN-containing dehydrogenase
LNPDSGRRRFLKLAAATVLSRAGAAGAQPAELRVNDVSGLNPVTVAKVVQPRSVEELRAVLGDWRGPVSVGGARFSMGGQIAAPGSLHLDMRALRSVVRFAPSQSVIRVQGGATWRGIQDVIDEHDLSVKIMQSYSNFTVGGSVSVNCHGRYVGRGPVVNSVRALQLVTVDGELLELERKSELFRAVCGGYGGLGVITEVELDLEPNERLERVVERVPLESYPEFFRERIAGERGAVLHNADLAPPDFDAPRAITWRKTGLPLTENLRLIPRNADYSRDKNAIWSITELPGGGLLRDSVERRMLDKPAVVWRNYEASLDTASLEPRTRKLSTYLLQEYFIPVANFVPFARAMARILKAHATEARKAGLSGQHANVLNISIRHSPADGTTLMPWAPVEVFSFVLYYKQRVNAHAAELVASWTQELIDAALAHRGRYYLPYRLDATRRQFARAYPEATRFAELKRRVDPQNRLRNLLWDRYLPASGK